jgi:hypothetical protein
MKDQENNLLGEISARYESQDPGTISTGRGDHGGMSYGVYQLSKHTIEEYLRWSVYKNRFNDVRPCTEEFNERWRELAKNEPDGFSKDQHDFVRATHYDVQAARLKADGLDLSGRGIAVQEALWSTSVQTGGLVKKIFKEGLAEKFGQNYKLSELTDKEIVEAVQDFKLAHTQDLFRSSPSLWDGLRNRALNEKEDLLALADGRPLPERRHANGGDALRQGMHGKAVKDLQTRLNEFGYLHDAPDGAFGPLTQNAVEDYQRDRGLTPDGKVGPGTQRALKADIRSLGRHGDGPAVSAAFDAVPGTDDPRNPLNRDHQLFITLQRRLPDASEDRLVQFTAACHMKGITNANLGEIRLLEEAGLVHFSRSWPPGPAVFVDLKAPMPSPQQAIQQVLAFDEEQAIQEARAQAQRAQSYQQQGPMPGGPIP